MKMGQDFFVGYSPERINPGDVQHSLQNTMKIVSACDTNTLENIAAVYGKVVKAGIHKAPTIEVAESAKIMENTQRDVNIALMNEFSIIFNEMGINTYDVLEAAGTKWNFLKFYPGLVGGHCIGVDPYYLTYSDEWKDFRKYYCGEKEFDGKGYGDFKMAVGEAVVSVLKPLQDEVARLEKDKAYIDSIIKNNAEKANYFATKTLRKVQKKVGFPERIR